MEWKEFWNTLLKYLADGGIKLLFAILLLVVGLKLIQWLVRILSSSKLFEKVDENVRSFLKSVFKAMLYLLLFLTVAHTLGIPMTSFITILATAGAAIGLALQGGLSNLAGGVMLLMMHPFKAGDYVEVAGLSGTVRAIGIFYTVLVKPDNIVVTIPNGTITSASITNYSAEDIRRVDTVVSVAYDSDLEKVKKILLKIADENEQVLREPEPMARLDTMNSSSLDFVFRVWCKAADYWTVYFALRETIKKAFDANGISIPFPQMDIHVDQKS